VFVSRGIVVVEAVRGIPAFGRVVSDDFVPGVLFELRFFGEMGELFGEVLFFFDL